MNIIDQLHILFERVRTSLTAQVGSYADIQDDARRLRGRVAALMERNNSEANTLENEIAEREARIQALDDETVQAENIHVGLTRLLGEA